VKLCSIDKKYKIEFEAMDQEKICSNIPKIEHSDCIEYLEELGIFASDVSLNENSCLCENSSKEIHVLLGADLIGKLYTGEIKNLSNGLVAMNTYFGWTVMGRTGERNNTSEVLLSLSLGITEPNISQTRSEIEEAAKNPFVRSLKRNYEGRYQVSIPWSEVHPELPANRNIAERRLKSASKETLRQEGGDGSKPSTEESGKKKDEKLHSTEKLRMKEKDRKSREYRDKERDSHCPVKKPPVFRNRDFGFNDRPRYTGFKHPFSRKPFTGRISFGSTFRPTPNLVALQKLREERFQKGRFRKRREAESQIAEERHRDIKRRQREEAYRLEREEEDSPGPVQDLISVSQEVRYSRYGRALKPTKRLDDV
jgi:hypothetical protein